MLGKHSNSHYEKKKVLSRTNSLQARDLKCNMHPSTHIPQLVGERKKKENKGGRMGKGKVVIS